MTEQEDARAARAFRDAFAAHGDEAPLEPLAVPTAPRRRTWWVAGAAAAAVVAAVAVPTVLTRGDDTGDAPSADDPTTAVTRLAPGHRWLGYRDVEVQVPESWPFGDSPSRPDCASLDRSYRGPERPYVEIGTGFGAVVGIGCSPEELPADLPAEFGVLPFQYWVSHVTLADPREDSADGSWTFRGWTLTRRTVADVQVSVLAAPEDAGLADDVLASARTVTTDANGCPVTSRAQEEEFQVPAADPVPDGTWRGVVALCQYSRGVTSPAGLIGSRQLAGAAARSLVAAIGEAPVGGGPDNPGSCSHDDFGETALVLRFLPSDPDRAGTGAVPEAYVYYDSCFGNGIVDSATTRTLTRSTCLPLFAEPPVRLWIAHSGVANVCIPPPE